MLKLLTRTAAIAALATKRDSEGNLLRAGRTYRLHVPADVPAANFWALALHGKDTRRPREKGAADTSNVGLDSRMGQLQYNDDGSIDLYVGAKAPEGMESNFLRTVDRDGWLVCFRLSGSTEPFFHKSFALHDVEPVG
jgi:hypothetical protein